MASQYPVGDHDDPTLFAIKKAFYDVWTVLAAHEPYRDRTQDDERKMELSRTLMGRSSCFIGGSPVHSSTAASASSATGSWAMITSWRSFHLRAAEAA